MSSNVWTEEIKNELSRLYGEGEPLEFISQTLSRLADTYISIERIQGACERYDIRRPPDWKKIAFTKRKERYQAPPLRKGQHHVKFWHGEVLEFLKVHYCVYGLGRKEIRDLIAEKWDRPSLTDSAISTVITKHKLQPKTLSVREVVEFEYKEAPIPGVQKPSQAVRDLMAKMDREREERRLQVVTVEPSNRGKAFTMSAMKGPCPRAREWAQAKIEGRRGKDTIVAHYPD